MSTDEATRDYAYGETDPMVRRCRLLPWIPAELEGVNDVTSEPSDLYYEVRQLKNGRSENAVVSARGLCVVLCVVWCNNTHVCTYTTHPATKTWQMQFIEICSTEGKQLISFWFKMIVMSLWGGLSWYFIMFIIIFTFQIKGEPAFTMIISFVPDDCFSPVSFKPRLYCQRTRSNFLWKSNPTLYLRTKSSSKCLILIL